MMSQFESIFKEWEKNNIIPIKDKHETQELKKKTFYKKENLTIDLHGLIKNEALIQLENFIKKHQRSVKIKIKIIHGVGRHSQEKRVLKDAVLEWLKNNTQYIEYYRPGRPGEGSGGVTIATIKIKNEIHK